MNIFRFTIVVFLFASIMQASAGEFVLPYSIRINGNGWQRVTDMAYDPSNGDVIVAGVTTSTDLPARAGAYQSPFAAKENGFVMRFNKNCSEIKFTAIIGGAEADEIRGVAINAAGDILLAGNTSSGDGAEGFPAGAGAFDSVAQRGEQDAFFAVLSGNGRTLLYSSFLGGEKSDKAADIISLSGGLAIVVGETESVRFPGAAEYVSERELQGFVSAINMQGGSARKVTSFLLGGKEKDYCAAAARISDNKFAVVGATESVDFPTTSGLLQFKGKSDAFAAIFEASPQLKQVAVWCLGGSSEDLGRAIAYNGDSLLAIAGVTSSIDFPIGGKPLMSAPSGKSDAFTAICSTSGALLYSTYWGGEELDSATAVKFIGNDEIILTGSTMSKEFPLSGLSSEWLADRFAGANDCFLSAISLSRKRLLYSATFGGSKSESPAALIVDDKQNIAIAGWTNSPSANFSPNFVSFNFPAASDDGFITLCNLRPNLYTDRQQIYFPEVYIGEETADSVIIIATGLGVVEYKPLILDDSEGNFSVVKVNRMLPSRDSDTVAITFTPKYAGMKSATLRFVSGKDTLRPKINLYGTGKNSVATTNLPLTFDAISVGDASEPKNVIIKNYSNVERQVDTMFSAGFASSSFKVISTFPIIIPAGKSVEVPVVFSPKMRGQYSCELHISVNGYDIAGKLYGVGLGPFVVSTETQIFFDSTETGDSSVRSVQIRNIGELSGEFEISVENDAENNFSAASPDRGELARNEKIEVDIVFSPKSPGRKNATLTISGPKIEPLHLQLFGYGTSSRVMFMSIVIDSLSALIGESVTIPARIAYAAGIDPNFVRRFEAVLRYNGSMLGFGSEKYPTRAMPPWRYITLTGVYPRVGRRDDSLLFEATLVAAQGDARETAVELDSLRWYDDNNSLIPSRFVVRNGNVRITDSDTSLLTSSKALSVKSRPNPASDFLTLDLISPVANPILTFYSITGEVVARQKLEIAPNVLQAVQFSVKQFGRGYYIATLSDGKFTAYERCYILTP